MVNKFLFLQWKTVTRSTIWQKNLALNIVVGFFLFLFAIYLLLLGLFIDPILGELYPGEDKMVVFNGFLLYYFLADLFIRFIMQGLPRLNIESFLHLPIKKSTLVNFIVSRTIIDIFNLIPLLIFVPVLLTMVFPLVGGQIGMIWMITILMLILANNFFATWLKRELGVKPLINAIAGMVLLAVIILEKFKVISLSAVSSKGFHFISNNGIALILVALWLFVAYWIHYQFLKKHLYPDEMQVKKSYEIESGATESYLRTFGFAGSVILLEMKLYWRNKRTRTIIYMLPIFLLYGFFFYPNPVYHNQTGFYMFVGVFMTGGMMLNYTNYAFGYESCYFDFLLTRNIDFYQYIRVKFYIAILISTLCYILTIPYLFYGWNILLINTAMYFYNIGVLSYILLYMATYNKKRMDLTRGGAFNYQGIGAMNWLAALPAFLLPLLLTIPFRLIGYPYLGIVFTGFLGILGLALNSLILKKIGRNFYTRKYIMSWGFRERG